MKMRLPLLLASILWSGIQISTASSPIPSPEWPTEWDQFNPPAELQQGDTLGEAIYENDLQKWIYLSQSQTERYLAADDNYIGDIYLLGDLGDGNSQNVAMYGASSNIQGNINIYLQSGIFYTTYGGGRAVDKNATVEGNTSITIGGTTGVYTEDVSQTKAVYGGGYAGTGYSSTVTGSSNIRITEKATFDNYSSVFGGGYTDSAEGYTGVKGGSHILIDGGVAGSNLKVQGGGWAWQYGTAEVVGGAHIELKEGGYVGEIYGGGRTSGTPNKAISIIDTVKIDITGGEAGSVIGGGESNWFGLTRVTDGIEINIQGGVIKDNLVGGGEVNGDSTALLKGHAEVQGGTKINISGTADISDVYGGGILFGQGIASTVEGGSIITMSGGTVKNIHGGGALYATAMNSSSTNDYNLLVSVDKAIININKGNVEGNVFGGGESVIEASRYSTGSTFESKVGSTYVNISGGTIKGQVYGGGNGTNANVTGDTNVFIKGGEMGGVSGGGTGIGENNTIGGNTYVDVSGGTIKGNVFGGSFDQHSIIKGNTHVTISGGVIKGDVYAGSFSFSDFSPVKGDATLKLQGNNYTVSGNFYGGYADGSKILELSGVTTTVLKNKEINGFDKIKLTNGTIQDINDLSQVQSLVVEKSTLKGSGSFGNAIINSGTLIVGNSPGTQTFSNLAIDGTSNAIFSIGGTVANDGLSTGWGTNTYSQLKVENQLTLGTGTQLTLELGMEFLNNLENGKEYSFDLASFQTLIGDISDVKLAYSVYDEVTGTSHSITSPFSNGRLETTSTGTGIKFTGTVAIPEPSSTMLGLIGLFALSLRRRRIQN